MRLRRLKDASCQHACMRAAAVLCVVCVRVVVGQVAASVRVTRLGASNLQLATRNPLGESMRVEGRTSMVTRGGIMNRVSGKVFKCKSNGCHRCFLLLTSSHVHRLG